MQFVGILGALIGIGAALVALFWSDDGVARTAIVIVLVILVGQLATRLSGAARGR